METYRSNERKRIQCGGQVNLDLTMDEALNLLDTLVLLPSDGAGTVDTVLMRLSLALRNTRSLEAS